MEFLGNAFSDAQQWLFETLIQPVMFALGLADLLVDGYDATGWLLVGLIQMAVLVTLIGPLQRWRPVEAVTDHAAVRTDMLYTVIHRLGLFRVVLFFSLDPLFDQLFGALRVAGLGTFHLDAVWPGVTDQALVSLVIYLLAIDLLNYWIHRGQHQFGWWWTLHSLHHSQRQMTMWSDNRNHLLDDVIRDVLVVVVAQLIGIAPSQFVAIVALTQLSENFQHANVRIWFGRWGERLWISPRFHRLHHSVGIGHESAGKNTLGGSNFGVLLPWWDMLFGTANFELRFDPTGVRDQGEQGRDYGRGFWAQQWLGLKRLAGRA
ncbi:MAG: sterol desaturase family protein [Rhodoferax sp.]|uniref:sterol desaturase family protein n=1 Tax=Rhodoferax sp. TaxID=50421 RepID=UPI0027196E20|nr:sterol desaturase family protein [Rhodoferax sp.]MDO8449423.1 sterol desaturase family protein [Rhodoferax sp.]